VTRQQCSPSRPRRSNVAQSFNRADSLRQRTPKTISIAVSSHGGPRASRAKQLEHVTKPLNPQFPVPAGSGTGSPRVLVDQDQGPQPELLSQRRQRRDSRISTMPPPTTRHRSTRVEAIHSPVNAEGPTPPRLRGSHFLESTSEAPTQPGSSLSGFTISQGGGGFGSIERMHPNLSLQANCLTAGDLVEDTSAFNLITGAPVSGRA
jgi:hypothetical protein